MVSSYFHIFCANLTNLKNALPFPQLVFVNICICPVLVLLITNALSQQIMLWAALIVETSYVNNFIWLGSVITGRALSKFNIFRTLHTGCGHEIDFQSHLRLYIPYPYKTKVNLHTITSLVRRTILAILTRPIVQVTNAIIDNATISWPEEN